jgi:hypothetical protein
MLHAIAAVFTVTVTAVAQVQWVQIPTPASPGPRYEHAMAYDAARSVCVMFGGVQGATRFGDTWTYDGSTWTQQMVSGPSPRARHTLAYDAQRQVVVLFGGMTASAWSNETWEWNGVAWTQRTPAASPPALASPASAPFPPLGGIVVLGSDSGGAPRFWRWDGISWQDLTDASTPTTPSLWQHGLAYHAGRQQLLLHGPTTIASWDGTNWLPADRSAGGRNGGGLVYDSTRNRLVAHGGHYQTGYQNPLRETWVWDGIWADLQTPPNISGRALFAMAFDAARGRVVAHGGIDYSIAPFGDTIELVPVTLPAPYVEPAVSGFAFTNECQHIGGPFLTVTSKPVLHTAGQFAWIGETLGLGCADIGGPFTPVPVALVYGTSNQSWGGVPLPWPLAVLGRPDCLLAVEPQLTFVSTVATQFSRAIPIPNAPALVGTQHFFQLIGNSAAGPWFTSNGVGIRIGSR